MPRQAAITIAIFALALIGMAASSPMVSAETGASVKTNLSNSTFSCAENWSCSGWSGCSDEGVSSRTCTDNNSCGTRLSKPLENQSCATATGIVSLTILKPPEICGDGKCSKNETCDSCPADCGRCSVAFGLTGLMAGAAGSSVSGLVVIFAMAILSIAMFLAARTKGNRRREWCRNVS